MEKHISALFFLGFMVVFKATYANPGNDLERLQSFYYKIEKGDELGSIIYSLGFSPLWGENGFVQKIVELNNVAVKENGDLVFPSDKLILPMRPILTCNTFLQARRVRIISKVKSKADYKKLLSSFTSTCRDEHRKQSLASLGFNERRSITSQTKSFSYEKYEVQNFKRFGRFTVLPRIGFSNISIKDNAANVSTNLYSKANYGVKLVWDQAWSSSFETSYFLESEKQSYDSLPNRALEKASINLVNVGFGLKKNLSTRTYSTFMFAFGEEAYLNAPSTTTLRLDKGNTIKGRFGFGFDLAELSPFKLSTEIGGKGILGTDVKDYKADDGFGYYGSIMMNQKHNDKSFSASIEYEQIEKNISNFKQDHTNLRFSFGVTWEFGN